MADLELAVTVHEAGTASAGLGGVGETVAGVAGGIGLATVFGGLLSATIESSNALKSILDLFGSTVGLILRPIGDLLATFLRPLAMWLIPMAIGFNELLYSEGWFKRISLLLTGIGEILVGMFKIWEGLGNVLIGGLQLINPFVQGDAREKAQGTFDKGVEQFESGALSFISGTSKIGEAVFGGGNSVVQALKNVAEAISAVQIPKVAGSTTPQDRTLRPSVNDYAAYEEYMVENYPLEEVGGLLYGTDVENQQSVYGVPTNTFG